MYTHILFDLDGTLTDPAPGILRSLRYALEKLGIAEEDDGTLIQFIGPPLTESFRSVYGLEAAVVEEAIRNYREHHWESGLYENAVYPGIPELLAKLHGEGRTLYIATTKMTSFAEKVLEHFGLAHFFARIIGGHPDGTRTDKREIIGEILSGIADPGRVVMVGDRKFDILGAKAHSIDSVAVTYGYGSEQELLPVNPTYVVDSVEKLTALLIGGSKDFNKT